MTITRLREIKDIITLQYEQCLIHERVYRGDMLTLLDIIRELLDELTKEEV